MITQKTQQNREKKAKINLMNVAIVHELLTVRGGAERVAKVFADMFPQAPIYTLLYDEQKLGGWFPKERVREADIKKYWGNNHHLYLNQFPRAVEHWDFSEFDLIISSSSAFVHGIITNGNPKHLCYVHSPARYLWDKTYDVLSRTSKGPLGPLKKWYLERAFHKLRIWDAEVAPRPDVLIAASNEVRRRIELYWRRDATVIHPPIDDAWCKAAPNTVETEHPNYFITVSTLTDYKRIDRAIEACNKTQKHLKVIGEGPAQARLQKIAGPTIEFYGYREGDELRDLMHNAQALIIPDAEDFGLTPIEAMSVGTPAIVLRKGGALETVSDEMGMFFDEPTVDSLAHALQSFTRDQYQSDVLRNHAQKFTRDRFEKQITEYIDQLLKQ